MKVVELYNFLNTVMPFEFQENWDNSGMLISNENDVNSLLVCLDVTDAVLDYCVKNNINTIVSHHPVIFSGLKSLDSQDVVYKLIKNQISVISAHTNYDVYPNGTSYILAEKLGLKNIELDGFIATGEIDMTCSEELAKDIKQKFGTTIMFTNNNKNITKVCVIAGAGGGLCKEVLQKFPQAVISGEIKYHEALDFMQKGIASFSVGHDVSENISLEPLKNIIQNQFKNLEIEVFVSKPLYEFI